jgi:SAM-dependent methyltransferase
MNLDRFTQWVFLKINRGPSKIPRRLAFAKSLQIVKSFVNEKWLDLGAGDGTYLKFMSDKSYGLDIKPNTQKKIGRWNFNNQVSEYLISTFDVIWCSNLIEHVMRPHEFLLNIKKFLKPEGLLIIVCPQTLLRNPFIFKGTLHGGHVNFFNLTTLKLTIQYSGYKILFSGSPSFGRFGYKLSFLSPMIMCVASPINNFQYPDSAHKFLDNNGEIKFKDENFSH